MRKAIHIRWLDRYAVRVNVYGKSGVGSIFNVETDLTDDEQHELMALIAKVFQRVAREEKAGAEL